MNFDLQRVAELKSLVSNIFWRAEIEAWRSRATREGFGPLSEIDKLPHPQLPLAEAAFTKSGSYDYMNTPGFSLYLPFTDPYSEAPFALTAKL